MMHYEIYRSLFFASTTAFIQKIDISNEIIIDFKESKITDMNAIDAVNKITERYIKLNKKANLGHLSPNYRKLLKILMK
ncbi:MAG: hypothetical protein RL619_706 [Bacteroidota bacterium]